MRNGYRSIHRQMQRHLLEIEDREEELKFTGSGWIYTNIEQIQLDMIRIDGYNL